MEIRQLTNDDRDVFRQIRLELFPEDDGIEWPVREYLSLAAFAFGAFIDGDLAGYSAGGLRSHAEGAWERPAGEQRIAYLEEWFVRPAFRRRGVGRALVEAVEAWAAERRADYLASDTELDNTVSQAAHAALGLAEVERAVHFLKPITSAPTVELSGELELREVDEDNGREIMRLRVLPAQDDFVAPNVISLAEASLTTDVLVLGLFVEDTAVGFAMVSTREHRYYLWRFMIDYRYQGRGYGRRAMELLIEKVRGLPNATEFKLSFVKAPGGPGPFYASLGFVETGEVHDGEHVMVMQL